MRVGGCLVLLCSLVIGIGLCSDYESLTVVCVLRAKWIVVPVFGKLLLTVEDGVVSWFWNIVTFQFLHLYGR